VILQYFQFAVSAKFWLHSVNKFVRQAEKHVHVGIKLNAVD